VSRTTAATALWQLDKEGFISRVGRGINRGADVWEIDPALGEGLAPAVGRIWATRPVFRVIGGLGAAEVYEALTTSPAPLSGRELAGMLGRSPTTVTGYLQELQAWGLAAGGGRGGWTAGPSDPDELAVRLGAAALVAAQVAAFRAERQAWWRWLESRGVERPTARTPGIGQITLLSAAPTQRHDAAARGDRAGPDRAVREAVELVRSVFGATLITAG
jgi:predicted transcriptional regulator